MMKTFSKKNALLTSRPKFNTSGNGRRWASVHNSRHAQNQTFSKKRTFSVSSTPPRKQVAQFRTKVPSLIGTSSDTHTTEIEVCNTNKMGQKSLLFLSISSPFFYSTAVSTNPTSAKFGQDNENEGGVEKIEHSFALETGCCVIPHPAKAYKGGEDANFVTSTVVGVADGVGGWADVGVDPAEYANKLMEGAKNSVSSSISIDPLSILNDAYVYAKDVIGSSTACIVSLDNSSLRAANLGDSGFMVIRGDKVIFRSKEQQHSFNFPFQLGTQSTSLPEHADIYEMPVEQDDLIILGSDGLFDNVFDEEIVDVCKQEGNNDPKKIADAIGNMASRFANHRTRLSPFAKAAQQQGHLFFIGGKLDDITVLVSKVTVNTNKTTSNKKVTVENSDGKETQTQETKSLPKSNL